MIGGAVCAIEHDLEAVKMGRDRNRGLAGFNVSPLRVMHTCGLAQFCRVHCFHGLIKHGFDRFLGFVRQLGAFCREKFQAIVVERIV